MNINKMMKQAQKMQADMQKVQAEIDAKDFEETTNNIVRVTLKGTRRVEKIEILEKIDDMEMLADLVTIAINNCLEKIECYAKEKMDELSPGLPGMF